MSNARSLATEAVGRLLERWDANGIARWELQNELVALLNRETIDAVVEALPEEHRADLLEYFDRLGAQRATDEELITIRAGTFFTRERHPSKFSDEEWNRIEREDREREAREQARFRDVTLPAILEWRAGRDR